MFEVHVDIALIGECSEAFGEGLEFQRGVAAVSAQPVAGVGFCGMDLRREEVVTFSDAERGIVIAEDGEGLLGEPGFVTELEGDWRSAFYLECRGGEEVFEAIRICFEIRRKLEEEQTEFVRLAHWFQGSNELGYVGATIL